VHQACTRSIIEVFNSCEQHHPINQVTRNTTESAEFAPMNQPSSAGQWLGEREKGGGRVRARGERGEWEGEG